MNLSLPFGAWLAHMLSASRMPSDPILGTTRPVDPGSIEMTLALDSRGYCRPGHAWELSLFGVRQRRFAPLTTKSWAVGSNHGLFPRF